VDSRFLFYYLSRPSTAKWLENHAVGATMANLNTSILESVPVQLPPLPVQRRIAGVLSAYDDLIENNARRIALLEDMAQAVYREWFVELRFPGHADAQMRETEALGAVPAGWEVVTVPEAIEINPRISIPDGEKHYVPMAGIPENSMIVRHTEMRDTRRGRKFQNYDTLFARITPSLENGKTGYVQFMPSDDDVGVGSGELINLRSKTLCPEYVYLLARTEPFRQNAIKSMTGASGRQRVQLDCFDDFRIAQPDKETLAQFERTVRPMFEMVQTLVERNATLRRTRDLLLPRLVSGEVAVEAAEETVAEELQASVT
jgi:type I restriction enzyme S subunit